MKIITTFFVVLSIFFVTNCFSQTTFETTIQSGPDLKCGIDNLFQISDQSYYVPETHAYTGDCANSGNYIFSNQTHLDINGNIQPANLGRFDFTYNNNKVVKVISAARIIIQNDVTGDTLVNQTLPQPFWHFFQKPTIDNFFISVMPTSFNTDTIEKYDSLANRLFKKTFTKDSSNMSFEYFPSSDSGIYQIRNFKISGNGPIYKRQVVKYNTSIDSIWFKNIGPEGKVYQSPEYRLIIVKQDSTQKQITTFNENLDTVRSVNFNDSVYWDIILPTENEAIVSTAYYTPNFYGASSFGKIDSNGNTLWRYEMYPIDTSVFRITKLIQTRDRGFLLGGYHDIVPTDSMHCFLPTTESVVMKIDSMGVLTKIVEQKFEKSFIFIYPNPANSELHLRTFKNSNDEASVSIINLLGKTVMEDEITLNGESIILIDRLPAGIYFLQIVNERNQFAEKFIKE